ncbi:MAG: GldG family protein [Clostridia bacterium]|nr:GldG family protein [Clostridia bacterium]
MLFKKNKDLETQVVATEKVTKPKKLKNQALFKKGGYSLLITALVLAGIIVINVLTSALANRVNLEFDMSVGKANTISEENVEYIKSVEKEIDITVCADKDTYEQYLASYATTLYNATGSSEYYAQTVNILDKYGDYNDNITVTFVDPQSTEFLEISAKYTSVTPAYGDVIVSTEHNGKERFKHVTFEDIYELYDEGGYAAYGYSQYQIVGNNIETAITGAIAYVESEKDKKVGILAGHSSYDYTEKYVSLLNDNNYETEVIEDTLVTSISSDYDLILLMAPTTDFIAEELDAIAEYLDNDGNLGKGLIFFADATNPALPNLYEFLAQWGIFIEEGILFETDDYYRLTDDPSTLRIYMPDGATQCVTGTNVPMTETEPIEENVEVETVMNTTNTVVNAPLGSAADYSDYTEDDLGEYSGVIEACKSDTNDDGDEINSYIYAFSSIGYIQSDWAEYDTLYNKNICLDAADTCANVGDAGISFVSKTITNESFADSVTAAGSAVIRLIFMILLPIVTIAVGVYIFIRRRNA